MRVQLVLYSILREKLPVEARGRSELDLPEGTRVADVFSTLELPSGVAWAINGTLEKDLSIVLQDGDELSAFRQGSGGSCRYE